MRPENARQVLRHHPLDGLHVVRLDVQSTHALRLRLLLAEQPFERDAVDLGDLLEAQPLVEGDCLAVLRLDLEEDVGHAAFGRCAAHAAEQLATEAAPPRAAVDPEIRDVRRRRAVVAVTCERIADRRTVVLGDEGDAVGDHSLHLPALDLGRILVVRVLRQLRIEPLDKRHDQVDVLGCGAANRHEPTPA